MKIIIDTNVFISGIFFKGPPYNILNAWKNGKFKLVISNEILNEYKRVSEKLSDKFKDIDITEIIDLVAIKADMTFQLVLPEQVTEDPDDEKFIATALASKTKIIVSGDKHLLNVSGYKGIKVLKPKKIIEEFL